MYLLFRRLAHRGGVERLQSTINEHIHDVIKSRLGEVAFDQELATRTTALTIKVLFKLTEMPKLTGPQGGPSTQSMPIILNPQPRSIRGVWANPEARPSPPRTLFSLQELMSLSGKVHQRCLQWINVRSSARLIRHDLASSMPDLFSTVHGASSSCYNGLRACTSNKIAGEEMSC
jgi:hypothetical protein